MFLFTSALFLSGYVIQQQTVRDLRAAIKPHEQPPQVKIYLPAKFAKPSPKEHGVQVQVTKSTEDSQAETVNTDESTPDGMGIRQKPMQLADQRAFDLIPEEGFTGIKPVSDKSEKIEKPMSRAERRRKLKEELTAGSEEEGFRGYRRRMW